MAVAQTLTAKVVKGLIPKTEGLREEVTLDLQKEEAVRDLQVVAQAVSAIGAREIETTQVDTKSVLTEVAAETEGEVQAERKGRPDLIPSF